MLKANLMNFAWCLTKVGTFCRLVGAAEDMGPDESITFCRMLKADLINVAWCLTKVGTFCRLVDAAEDMGPNKSFNIRSHVESRLDRLCMRFDKSRNFLSLGCRRRRHGV